MMKEEKLPFKVKAIYLATALLACLMHFYRLGSIPYGLHIDEAGMAYDAFCLANYSVDRYLNHFPVYLINYGGGQSALYAYLTAALIRISGDVNPWIIRLPGALIGMLGYFSGVAVIRKCMGEKWGLLSSFLLTSFPYFIMQSRFGLDCNLLLGISTFGIWMLLKAEEKKKMIFFILAGIVWGFCYYTYALGYLGNTLFLGAVLLYWLYHKRITWKNAFSFGIPILLMVWPLIVMLVINKFGMDEIETVLFTIPNLPGFRDSELSFSRLEANFWNTWKVILTKDEMPYNALGNYLTMYGLSIPFAIIGTVRITMDLIKDIILKKYSAYHVIAFCLYAWLLLGMFIGGSGPNINRLNGIFFALFFCVLYGMSYIFTTLKKWLYEKPVIEGSLKDALLTLRYPERKLAGVIGAAYFICFLSFTYYYFNEYSRDVYPQSYFADTCKDIIDFIEVGTGEPKVVYMDAPYIYYLLSAEVNPYEAGLTETYPETYWKYVFHLPEEIDGNAIYIVRETNTDYKSRLQEMSFDVYRSGMYECYY